MLAACPCSDSYQTEVGAIKVEYPEFRSRDPLRIERDIVYLRFMLSQVGKDRFFELYRALRTSEKVAISTFKRRSYYWKKMNSQLETNGDGEEKK